MRNNDSTNNLIKWLIILGDFMLLNVMTLVMMKTMPEIESWQWEDTRIFLLTANMALAIAESRFRNIVYRRLVTVGDIIKRVVLLTITYALVCFFIMNLLDWHVAVGWVLFMQGTLLFVLLIGVRYLERQIIKVFRQRGRNTRTMTFVGNDPELMNLYELLVKDVTMGYRALGYYADGDLGEWTYSKGHIGAKDVEQLARPQKVDIEKLGSLQDLMDNLDKTPGELNLGDELYVSLSRRDREIVRRLSDYCDKHVIRFFYVPVSVESLGINLKHDMIEEMEIYTTYENPLASPVNKGIKRAFDVVMSMVFLIPTAIIFPFVWVIMKCQSPGPLLFKQTRTGLDGKDFEMLKFRSMHVNNEADKLQATKNDPRKYPFGNFMRKTNIDELPQFLNVLKGDMSIVGPRPHMLAHTEQYSKLIDKYMVRHFVKPGLTGWAQVTGYRGETKELWQMEGRVKRDIWYIEHWSIWLDIRIIWMTIKTFFVHDKNAY